jgi:hypothetical protein
MLGLVMMTLVAATAPPLPAADAADACGDGTGRCELAALVLPPAPRHEDYATPAVIDCRSPVAPLVVAVPVVRPAWFLGECEGPHDASYRTSRYPESEDSQSLSPGSRDRRGGVVSCDGLPGRAPALPLSDAQPLALFATPVVVAVATAARLPLETSPLTSRFGDPPDRPPRV